MRAAESESIPVLTDPGRLVVVAIRGVIVKREEGRSSSIITSTYPDKDKERQMGMGL